MTTTVKTLIATLLLTSAAACNNSMRESNGTRDTDGRGGSTTREANPSPTPQAEQVNPQESSQRGTNPETTSASPTAESSDH